MSLERHGMAALELTHAAALTRPPLISFMFAHVRTRHPAPQDWGKESGPDELLPVLKQILNGEIKAEYHHKDKRKSLDRRSVEQSPSSITAATTQR